MIHNEKYHLFPIITLIHNKLTLKLLLLMIYLILNWKDYVLKLCIRAHILRHEISLKLLPIIQIVNCLELLTFLASLHCLASFLLLDIKTCLFIIVVSLFLSFVKYWVKCWSEVLPLKLNYNCAETRIAIKVKIIWRFWRIPQLFWTVSIVSETRYYQQRWSCCYPWPPLG